MSRNLTTKSLLLGAIVCAAACNQPPQRDAYLVNGLRLLGVKAEPPQVKTGQTTKLTALVVDTQSRAIALDWSYCSDSRPTGQKVNFDCITQNGASFLHPFGNGISAMLTAPTVDATTFGSPDRTGGVYLPVRINATAGTDSQISVYYLRMGNDATPNQNPTISGVVQVTSGGTPNDAGVAETLTPLDPMTPMVVHSGDKLTLRVQFMTGSAETYVNTGSSFGDGGSPDGGSGGSGMSTENLSASWFTTGGTIGGGFGGGFGGGGFGGGGMPSDVTLTLDNNLPAVGGLIDLWVVTRDNRGGTDYQHRTLMLQ